ncbi:hypothetical protein CC80DRAFT_518534 [Byssothecium circinans]|uniref:Uncharacterized protein n=1 Tax=Byssothecium circinans TaxID=147558 RepID=A0A6A5TMF9_9PLEO|nr:hypothetical protein CC80DRAFT_518534 [Byssothecium circinans]
MLQERKSMFKLDLTLMTFGCLGTFIKYIDRANINSTFVSGRKEDLSLYGNELNYVNTAFSIANIIGLWPCNLHLTKSNPNWFIPILELGWKIYTVHYSAIVYLCGGWYKNSYLQAAVYTGLNGVHGMAGWQWLFIVNGGISLGIIIPQCFFYPDVPARQKQDFVFTDREIELARGRNPLEGRVKQGKFTKTQMECWLLTPETPIQTVMVVITLLMAWSSDTWLKGRRWPMLVLGGAINVVVRILLATTLMFPQQRAFRWFLYY